MGKYSKKRTPLPKKWLLAIIAGAVAVVLAVSAVLVLPSTRKPVSVYSFDYIGMTEYWGDSQESYGPVSTDKIQTVFLSDTQTLTEVKVAQGDQVKKGDLLLTYDTTLSELALERKRLDVEREKFQLTQDKARLEEIRNMVPYYAPVEIVTPETKGEKLVHPSSVRFDREGLHTGMSEENAVICWVSSNQIYLREEIVEDIRREVRDKLYPAENYKPEAPTQPVPPETTEPEETEPEDTKPDETEPDETTQPEETTEPDETTQPEETDPPPAGEREADATRSSPSALPGPLPTLPGATEPEKKERPNVSVCYVVFKVTKDDYVLSEKTVWQGVKIMWESNGSFNLRYFTPTIEDYTEYSDDPFKDPAFEDNSSGYTPNELYQMKIQQTAKIAEQDFKVRLAEAEYKIMEAEFNDGSVYAEIDGTVVSLLTEEEAKESQQPVLKVSGGGGFLIEGSVSELMKDTLTIGQEVTVNDWNTGGSYTGTIEAIGDFPTPEDGWTGMGNPNASYYPFYVFVGEDADLRAGTYASIQYAAAGSSQGIYLENPFIRTEGAKSYVLARGKNGRLEKRYVTVGKSLWGSYTEILSGVTEEDFLAFPYAKEAKPGAQTKEGDLAELYSY